MKICVTNHFETDFEAQTYFACLNVDHPLIRPDPTESAPVYVISPENQLPVPLENSSLLFGLSAFEVVSSSLLTLTRDLTQAFLTSINKLVLVTLRLEKQPCAVWVFAGGRLKAAIPFATKISVLVNEASWFPLATTESMTLDFLVDYLNYLRRERSIFVLANSQEQAVSMAAILRTLTESRLIYGKAQSAREKKTLKTFNFLTHDLPDGPTIDLGDLFKVLTPILHHLQESPLMLPQFIRQIKQWKEKSRLDEPC